MSVYDFLLNENGLDNCLMEKCKIFIYAICLLEACSIMVLKNEKYLEFLTNEIEQ